MTLRVLPRGSAVSSLGIFLVVKLDHHHPVVTLYLFP